MNRRKFLKNALTLAALTPVAKVSTALAASENNTQASSASVTQKNPRPTAFIYGATMMHLSDLEVQDKVMRCLKTVENNLFHPGTNLIYDYLTSWDSARKFDHLPTPVEISRCLPNPCSWRSGQEDSVINGGVALDMYIHSNNGEMARKIYQGLRLCGTVSGIPGFVARSISPRDGKSFYPESSRDQYTHYVYALWHYFHSDLSSKEEKSEIVKLLTDVANFCEKHVTKENNWTLPRADGNPHRSSVCRMWESQAHEIARLPMFYAAAWSVSGNDRYLKCFNRYAYEAAERSMNLYSKSYRSFALMQMTLSCRLIHDLAPDAALKQKYAQVMDLIDEYLNFNLLRAGTNCNTADFSAMMPNWHTIKRAEVITDCGYALPERPEALQLAFQTIRDCTESIIAALLMPTPRVTLLRRRIFRAVLKTLTPEKHCTFAPLFFPAAWYLAKHRNVKL